jgi:hypothetical protein
MEAVKIKGKGEGEKVWGGGNCNYLSPLCYAISTLPSFYGLATPHYIYIYIYKHLNIYKKN